MELGIYGASDDNAELRLDGKDLEEFAAWNTETVFTIVPANPELGGCVVRLKHAHAGWTFGLEMLPEHEDGQPMRTVVFRPAPNGYSYEALVRLADDDTVVVRQGDETKAVLKGGKLVDWETVQQDEALERCDHGLLSVGKYACPVCKEA